MSEAAGGVADGRNLMSEGGLRAALARSMDADTDERTEGGATFETTSPSTGAVTGRCPKGHEPTPNARSRPRSERGRSGRACRRSTDDRGASVIAGGARAPQHRSELFFEATVLEGVTNDMAIAREETFGSVVPVSTIERAGGDRSRGRFGIRAAVGDLHRRPRARDAVAEAVRTGWVDVNGGTNSWESRPVRRPGRVEERRRPRGRQLLDEWPTVLKTILIDLS